MLFYPFAVDLHERILPTQPNRCSYIWPRVVNSPPPRYTSTLPASWWNDERTEYLAQCRPPELRVTGPPSTPKCPLLHDQTPSTIRLLRLSTTLRRHDLWPQPLHARLPAPSTLDPTWQQALAYKRIGHHSVLIENLHNYGAAQNLIQWPRRARAFGQQVNW